MELFIRIKDGQPFEHPIFKENFLQAFPDVDIDNLPTNFAYFERVQAPVLGPYTKNQRVKYERGEDGIYRDTWYYDELNDDEIKAKQENVKAQWIADENNPKSWVFKEDVCSFVPPIDYPTDGKSYIWDEAALSWIEINSAPVIVDRV